MDFNRACYGIIAFGRGGFQACLLMGDVVLFHYDCESLISVVALIARPTQIGVAGNQRCCITIASSISVVASIAIVIGIVSLRLRDGS